MLVIATLACDVIVTFKLFWPEFPFNARPENPSWPIQDARIVTGLWDVAPGATVMMKSRFTLAPAATMMEPGALFDKNV
jgi:hypothetical protein